MKLYLTRLGFDLLSEARDNPERVKDVTDDRSQLYSAEGRYKEKEGLKHRGRVKDIKSGKLRFTSPPQGPLEPNRRRSSIGPPTVEPKSLSVKKETEKAEKAEAQSKKWGRRGAFEAGRGKRILAIMAARKTAKQDPTVSRIPGTSKLRPRKFGAGLGK